MDNDHELNNIELLNY